MVTGRTRARTTASMRSARRVIARAGALRPAQASTASTSRAGFTSGARLVAASLRTPYDRGAVPPKTIAGLRVAVREQHSDLGDRYRWDYEAANALTELLRLAGERFMAFSAGGPTTFVELVRDSLRPISEPSTPTRDAARSRAELHSAIVHGPEPRAGCWACESAGMTASIDPPR